MSKRNGDVQVTDYILSQGGMQGILIPERDREGPGPTPVNHHGAPDSTAIMSLEENSLMSPYTSVDHIKGAILLLGGRLMNIYDVPIRAPWLFIEPDLNTEEAQNMLKKISGHQFKHVLDETLQKLSQIPSESWRDFDFSSMLHTEQDRLGYSAKVYMKTLRHALTVMMKDEPSIADIVKALGRERTLSHLEILITTPTLEPSTTSRPKL